MAHYSIRKSGVRFDIFRDFAEKTAVLQIKNTNLLIGQIIKILKTFVRITDNAVFIACALEKLHKPAAVRRRDFVGISVCLDVSFLKSREMLVESLIEILPVALS